MFRRLPIFMASSLAATVGLFILTSVLTAQPPLPTDPTVPSPVPIDPAAIKRSQELNKKRFADFQAQVLRLAQRWEKSDSTEDKERAKALRAVLKLSEEKGVEKYFNELIEGLGSKNPTGGDFNKIFGNDEKLRSALQDILDLLNTEDEIDRIKKEIKDTIEAIKAIEELKRRQENNRARLENPNSDPNKVAKDQNDIKKDTQKTANAIEAKTNKDPKGNPNGNGNDNKQDPKAETKAEPKPGDNTGENKPDTNENKSDSKGDGMGMGSPMPGDPKAGEPKPGSPMGGDPKNGDKPSDKAGEPKAGEPKAGPPMGPMNPMAPSAGENKPMGGDSKAQGAGKGEGKPSAGQQGGEGKPMNGGGMGSPMPGMGSPSPGSPKSGGQQSPGGQQQGPKKDPAAEHVQQAVPQQQGAEDDIKKNDKQEASKKQDNAIDQLQKALDELEKRLKQLREKELAKLLSNLEERVNRMLRMQIDVQANTKQIDTTVKALGGKAGNAEIQKSQGEADKEGLIVVEADKALQLLAGEGTAVVFAGVLQQVKGDMESIQKRLNEARVGDDTQSIEQDVIDQLKMMLEALKKAKQELENKPSDPKPNDPNAKKPDQKLIDLLNELKLVKALQEQLNKRTIMYNKQDPGEQAKDPLIQGELKQLSDRQKVLQDMIHKIATQANQ